MQVTDFPIEQIIIEERQKRPVGKLEYLVASIEDVGLLHPIVVGTDGRLKVGWRRLEAFRAMGRLQIPAHVTDGLDDVYAALKAERDENIQREALPPSVIVVRAKELEAAESDASRRRQEAQNFGRGTTGANFAPVEAGKTRDKVGAAFGISGWTYEKAKAVADAAENDPEIFGDLPERMDTKSVHAAHREMVKRQRAAMPKPGLPEGKYAVIYADPPWRYSNTGFDESAEAQYPTMPIEEICSLPIAKMATDETVLFLWATNPLLPEALQAMNAWGFSYKTNIAWIKDRARGKGWWLKSKHELLLIGVRRNTPHPKMRPGSCFEAPRGPVHSRKPEKACDIIEAMFDGPRIELFARQVRKGWESWGDEL